MTDLPTPAYAPVTEVHPASPAPVMPDLSDLGGLLGQAMKMQEQLLAAQQEAASQVFTGVAGGGVVKVTVTGSMQFTGVHLSPSAVDPSDVEMLEDLVLAALHDASEQVRASAEAATNQALGGLAGLGLGGAGSGLSGLLG